MGGWSVLEDGRTVVLYFDQAGSVVGALQRAFERRKSTGVVRVISHGFQPNMQSLDIRVEVVMTLRESWKHMDIPCLQVTPRRNLHSIQETILTTDGDVWFNRAA